MTQNSKITTSPFIEGFVKDTVGTAWTRYGGAYRLRVSDGSTINFMLQGSSSGCGLGIFSQWTGEQNVSNILKHYKLFAEFLYKESKGNTAGFHALVVSLGDNWSIKNRTHYSPKYEELLHLLCFEKHFEFENKLHGVGYKQAIWILETDKLLGIK